MPMSSAISCTSERIWLDNITVIPCCGNERIKFRNSPIPIGSNPFVGSSRINKDGWFSNAIAIPNRCFIPIENCPAFFFPVFCKSTIFNTSFIRCSGKPNKIVLTFKFSYAVKFSYNGGFSIKAPICFKSCLFHAWLANSIVPDVGRSIPVTIFRIVDFPAPFGPNNPYTLFSRTWIDTSVTAECFPKLLQRFVVFNMKSIMFHFLSWFWYIKGTAHFWRFHKDKEPF